MVSRHGMRMRPAQPVPSLVALVVLWLGTGAATGSTLAGRRMARTEPTTLSRSFRLGTAAGMGSLIGLPRA
jgi:hypothetical protein